MGHDLSIPVLSLFVVDLVRLGRPSALAPIPHFFLDIEKSKRIQRKIQGKIADFARIHGIVVKFVLTMPRQKMYHQYSSLAVVDGSRSNIRFNLPPENPP